VSICDVLTRSPIASLHECRSVDASYVSVYATEIMVPMMRDIEIVCAADDQVADAQDRTVIEHMRVVTERVLGKVRNSITQRAAVAPVTAELLSSAAEK